MKQSSYYWGTFIWFMCVCFLTVLYINEYLPNNPIYIFYTSLFIGLGLLIHFKK